jgi:uncharacterized UPF0160 family protein
MLNFVTHSGTGHADDEMFYAIVSYVFPQHNLTRTRDPEIITKADIVFDVGNVYDVEGERYDHHQVGGAGNRPNGVPYASAGLGWKHYGHAYLKFLGYVEYIEEIHADVDEALIQGIDAIDNGVVESHHVLKGTSHEIRVMDLSSIMSGFNPNWHDIDQNYDRQFVLAAELAHTVLQNVCARSFAKHFAEGIVLTSPIVNKTLVLEKFMPWQEAVVKSFSEEQVLFVVFPDVSGEWRIQVVPKELGQFGARKDLPESWAGLRASELAEITGVEDAVFCHKGRFIAGTKTRESILKLAEIAFND